MFGVSEISVWALSPSLFYLMIKQRVKTFQLRMPNFDKINDTTERFESNIAHTIPGHKGEIWTN